MRGLFFVWLMGFATMAMADVPVPQGAFENSACVECHQQHNADSHIRHQCR